jgi:Carboxypeptidase regulatory-like domain
VAAWLRPLLLIAALVAHQGPETSSRAEGTVAGQVVDAVTGKPVGAVFVTLSTPIAKRDSTQSVLTASDSRFVFRGLPAGEYGLAAIKAGYLPATFDQRRPEGYGQRIRLESNGSRTDITIRVWKHAGITGAVVDETGEPVVGVHVRAFRRSSLTKRITFGQVAFGETDDRGIYRIGGLAPAEYLIVAGARQLAVPPSWAQRSIDTIRQPTGSPGTATALEIAGSVYGLGRGSAIPPPPKSGRLFIYPPTFHPAAATPGTATAVSLASGEERNGIDIQLHPTATRRVSGRVTWQGQPAPGKRLSLVPENFGDWLEGLEQLSTISDSDGQFSFPTAPPGTYSLRTEMLVTTTTSSLSDPLKSSEWSETPVTVGDADIDDLTVVIRSGLRLDGRMEFDGSARPNTLSIEVEPADPDTLLRFPAPVSRTLSEDRFAAIGLKPGRYYIRVPQPPEGWVLRTATYEGRNLSIVPLEVGNEDINGIVLEFTDRISKVSGTVASPDGKPDSAAAVVLFPTDAKRWGDTTALPPGFARGRVNPDGTYGLYVPAGSYYIAAIPEEQSGQWRDAEFLERVARIASLVTIVEGDQKIQTLQTVDVR